jgi:hypothetical protein
MAKNKSFGFQIIKFVENRTDKEELILSLWSVEDYKERVATFRYLKYQYEENPARWSHFTFEMDKPELMFLKFITKLAEKLESQYKGMRCDAGEMVEVLLSMGIEQGVYDSRVSDFVFLKDLAPCNLTAWGDDFKAVNYDAGACYESICVSVLAETEKDAKKEILKALANNSFYTRENYLEEWIHAGKPVYRLPYRESPNDSHWSEVLKFS